MIKKEKAIIILGIREDLSRAVSLIKDFGYKSVFFNTTMSLEEAINCDIPVEVNLNDEEVTIEKALSLTERYDIKAVFTLNEYRVALAAKISEALGLSHSISHQAAVNCYSKNRTRQLLSQNNVGSVKFALVRTSQDAKDILDEFSLPIVIKPSNDAGSNNVFCCHTKEEVFKAIERIQSSSTNWVGQKLDYDILIEEYLDGSEFSIEACTIKGKTNVLAITEKQILTSDIPVEIGHVVPANLAKEEVDSIENIVVNALSTLGVDNCVTHTEVKLTSSGPQIIEVNARPAGDNIVELVRDVTGYDMHELSLHIALGGDLNNASRHEMVSDSAAVHFLIAEKEGTLLIKGISDLETNNKIKRFELLHESGEQIEKTNSNYNRLGYFIVHGSKQQRAEEIVEKVKDCFDITIV